MTDHPETTGLPPRRPRTPAGPLLIDSLYSVSLFLSLCSDEYADAGGTEADGGGA